MPSSTLSNGNHASTRQSSTQTSQLNGQTASHSVDVSKCAVLQLSHSSNQSTNQSADQILPFSIYQASFHLPSDESDELVRLSASELTAEQLFYQCLSVILALSPQSSRYDENNDLIIDPQQTQLDAATSERKHEIMIKTLRSDIAALRADNAALRDENEALHYENATLKQERQSIQSETTPRNLPNGRDVTPSPTDQPIQKSISTASPESKQSTNSAQQHARRTRSQSSNGHNTPLLNSAITPSTRRSMSPATPPTEPLSNPVRDSHSMLYNNTSDDESAAKKSKHPSAIPKAPANLRSVNQSRLFKAQATSNLLIDRSEPHSVPTKRRAPPLLFAPASQSDDQPVSRTTSQASETTTPPVDQHDETVKQEEDEEHSPSAQSETNQSSQSPSFPPDHDLDSPPILPAIENLPDEEMEEAETTPVETPNQSRKRPATRRSRGALADDETNISNKRARLPRDLLGDLYCDFEFTLNGKSRCCEFFAVNCTTMRDHKAKHHQTDFASLPENERPQFRCTLCNMSWRKKGLSRKHVTACHLQLDKELTQKKGHDGCIEFVEDID